MSNGNLPQTRAGSSEATARGEAGPASSPTRSGSRPQTRTPGPWDPDYQSSHAPERNRITRYGEALLFSGGERSNIPAPHSEVRTGLVRPGFPRSNRQVRTGLVRSGFSRSNTAPSWWKWRIAASCF
ncbi:unnamed protein product [Merluccius merluccius]